MPIVTDAERDLFRKLASMSGWAIADHFGCEFDGDSNPIDHGGFFYSLANWEAYGYADAVEFWHDHDANRLVVQRGTINRPDDIGAAMRCIGISPGSPEYGEPRAQVSAAKAYFGMECEPHYPDMLTFNPDAWKGWRIWRAVAPFLRDLSK